MLILADTNVLLRLVEENHPQHAIANDSLAAVRLNGHRTVIVPQVVYEFWVVATRPVEVNGLGMRAAEAQFEFDELRPHFKLLLDERTVFDHWYRLVLDHDVNGKQVHDARIVAAMLRHDVSHLLTFNAADFARFSEISVIEPHRASDLEQAR
jgi:predicted nucleic acid-binding protein